MTKTEGQLALGRVAVEVIDPERLGAGNTAKRSHALMARSSTSS